MKCSRASLGSLLLCALLSACVDSDPVGVQSLAHTQLAAVPAGFTGDIRIGVVPSASSVTIGSTSDYAITEKTSGITLFSGNNGSAVVTIESQGVSRYRLQVVCGSAAAVNSRKAAAEALGYVTFTEYVPAANCTRLYLGDFASNASFSVRNAFRNKAIADGVAASDSFWKLVAVAAGSYRVTQGAQFAIITQPAVLTSSSGLVTINGITYRGTAEVRTNSASQLAGINQLPLEDYLYGVVPKELGPIAYPEVEAQKAQAIAARTYALSGIGKRASDGYDLLATTSDQVYGGYSAEHPVSNAAVDATRGIVLTYNDNLISALYSSASGGYTANNEEAFDGTPAPYLRGMPDAERGEAEEHVPSLDVFKMHANPNSLRNARESDFESDWSRFHRWSYEWSMQDMADVVSALAKTTVNEVTGINVVERGPSGRVQLIEFVTDAGTFSARKDAIRSALKYYNATHTLTSLPSTLFFIEPVYGRGPDHGVTGYIAYGGGFGHGVGMAQTGAVGMAQKGHTFDEILKHYYQGVELTQAY